MLDTSFRSYGESYGVKDVGIMQLRKIGAVFSFLLAFSIAVVVVSFVGTSTKVAVESGPPVISVAAPAPFEMRMLVGKWAGKWDHDYADCTVQIDRVAGDGFYGTLSKNRARIAISGTVNRKTGKVTIHETKVLTTGDYSWWSLGENSGVISTDGLTMSGTGHDKNGEYDWSIWLGSPIDQ